jgi:hypothetical protein
MIHERRSMPVRYDRDDVRRLITVTVTEPYALDEILSVIDRQAAEDTWEYAILYDMRAVKTATTPAQLQQLIERVKQAGAGRPRGPVGLALARRTGDFRVGLTYSQLTTGLLDVEVLVTADQLQGWLARHGHGAAAP